MTTKNFEKVIEVLAEKVASLELDLSFTKFERDEFKKENERLKAESEKSKTETKVYVVERKYGKDETV